MTDRLIPLVLVALAGIGAGMALAAPDVFASDVFASDAGPVAADAAPASPAVTAPAEAAPAPSSLLVDLLRAARARDYWGAFGAALLLAVWGLRKYVHRLGAVGRWLQDTDEGGTVFVLLVSGVGMIATVMLASSAPSTADLKAAVLFAIVAAGGWSVMLKRLLRPLWERVAG